MSFIETIDSNKVDNTLEALMHNIRTSFSYALPHQCPRDVTSRKMSKKVAESLKETFGRNDFRHTIFLYNGCEQDRQLVSTLTCDGGNVILNMDCKMKLNDILGTVNKLNDFMIMHMPPVKKLGKYMKNNVHCMSPGMYIEEVFEIN